MKQMYEAYESQTDYYGYIYLTYDQKHNKIYIGQKKGLVEDSVNYYGSGVVIRRIQNSRGSYFLRKYIIGVCKTKEYLDIAEIECIQFFQSFKFLYGYNISSGGLMGGDLRYGMTEDELDIWRKNLCKAQQKRFKEEDAWNKGLTKETDERVKQYAENRKGIKFTEEHKNNISNATKGKQKKVTKQGWSKGLTKETDERVKKRANTMKGHTVSDETRKKIGQKSKGRKHSEETKQKLSQRLNGKTYEEIYGEEQASQIKNKMKGRKAWNKGRKMSPAEIEKLKETKRLNKLKKEEKKNE